jgi:hypothetical protein
MTIYCFGIHDKSMEIRYQYNMDKPPTYYKPKSIQWLESMLVMLQNSIAQKKILLNTLDGKR